MITLYTITLTVACCIAVALALGSNRRRSTETSWVTTSTLAILSASCATLSTLSYAMAGPNGGNLVPLVIADVTMPLCVGLIAAAMRRAAGRARTYILPMLFLSVGVGAITLLVSPEAGQIAKLVTLSAFSLFAAVTCLWSDQPGLGARIVGGSLLFYGIYCALRLVAPIVWGPDAATVKDFFTQSPSTIVAAIVVVVVAGGTIITIRRTSSDADGSIVTSDALADWVGALLVQSAVVGAVTISVPDLPLHRAAFGRPWGQAVEDALDRAAVAAMPVGSVVGKVAPGSLVALQFGSAVTFDQLGTRLQEAYEELLPTVTPIEPPKLLVEPLTITSPTDLRRFAHRSRVTARRAMSSQGA